MNELMLLIETKGMLFVPFHAVLASMLLYFAIFILAEAWLYIWAWIDESPKSNFNPFNAFVMSVFFGYKVTSPTNRYYYCKKEIRTSIDGDKGVIATSIFFAIFPLIVIATIYNPMVLVVLGSLIALSYLARYARRNKKLFDKHIKDKNAHQ